MSVNLSGFFCMDVMIVMDKKSRSVAHDNIELPWPTNQWTMPRTCHLPRRPPVAWRPPDVCCQKRCVPRRHGDKPSDHKLQDLGTCGSSSEN